MQLTTTAKMPTRASTMNTSNKIQKCFTTISEQDLDEMDKRFAKFEAEQAFLEQERRKSYDIKRLGGLRQYEDFKAENYTNKSVLRALSNYPKQNYYLWGIAGAGKTHAAVAVARNIPNAQVVRMSQISRLFRSDKVSAEQETQYIEYYADIPLVLDDLGSEKMTEFLRSIFFEIIDRRWSNRTGGLIITANINLPALADSVGDRTVSRLAGLFGENIINIKGADRRMMK